MRLLSAALLAALLAAASASAMEMPSGGSKPMQMPAGPTSTEPCVLMPSMANCTAYMYPTANATEDITSLCTAMPFMTGCSLGKICTAGGKAAQELSDKGYCNPLSLIADTCVSDTGMSRMWVARFRGDSNWRGRQCVTVFFPSTSNLCCSLMPCVCSLDPSIGSLPLILPSLAPLVGPAAATTTPSATPQPQPSPPANPTPPSPASPPQCKPTWPSNPSVPK